MSTVLGDRLRTIRQSRNLSTWELSKVLDCPQSSIVAWEKGNYSPSIKYWIKIEEWINDKKSYQIDKKSYQPLKSQHPANDPFFMQAAKLLQDCCQIISGGTCECPYKRECERLFSIISERCSDRLLTIEEWWTFKDKHYELIHAKVEVK